MEDRTALRSRRAKARPALAAAALGVWTLGWGWAAEAHEPSQAGEAPSVLAVSAFATPTVGMNLSVDVGLTPAVGIGVTVAPAAPVAQIAPVLAAEAPGVVRRPWDRGRPPAPAPAPVVVMKPREPAGWLTFRGGFFDGSDVSGDDFVAGFKLTGRVADALHLGVSTDWQYRSTTAVERVDQYTGPGGSPVQVMVTSYETHSHLIPMMAVAELRPTFGAMQPFLGAGVGYELLITEVRDYMTGIWYEDEFGGFGWQPYGGIALALGRGTQLVFEGYGNFSTVDRTVVDASTGYLAEQEIDVDGFGLRAGLAFGF